ncbi:MULTISPECIES: glycoside hydrolase family 32 protein [unclassified Cryobacterium]|jgi:fructan beta-fructosidase|uniref:glycoside hydrolase family 32 protein n=1 Tax=unclassified Cryobacterium TaxID=2649013 RepID=UPI002AB37B13|nr:MULTISPECIES: glycoside hydrolase family 32 protein [unclassified Cryobacterium]MDY7543377.1 glycoside hydrolase family 32 protein [Cryobacterium sp. 5B3]MEA9999696.1 glycoside hydrolase family 32 protein [Cryobacterium sp. RTS3]MEB0264978.1 glycoside hydrolase family 32 protein [Cryobacterium sp. 10I5]MEB0274699.1 glycoside hydrolase family 32 protein [Cryobacterium sp. 5B3]
MSAEAQVAPLHREEFRPAFHYTADRNWLNDPNGLVYYKGLYHLFYQYNPHGNVWGNMSWGHASSPDLATWTEQPVAIAGDANEDIFSGSIVADLDNTSGFGTTLTPPLVAIYTSAFTDQSTFSGLQAQSLAFSLDDGRTWTKHRGNPVLNRHSSDFRDPKVFRYSGPTESYWVMVAVEAQQHKVVLYRSTDLTAWTYLSTFGPANAVAGVWECPDLFPLPVDGDPANIKWVLIVNLNPGGVAGGSGGQYFVGSFDGTTFASETTVPEGAEDESSRLRRYNWLDWGRDYYAAVSFSGVPHGKRIMIAWMNNWDYGNDIPTSPWKSSMSLPREVGLRTIAGEPRLIQSAIDIRQEGPAPFTMIDQSIGHGTLLLPEPAWGAILRIDVTITPGTADEIGMIVRGGADEGTSIGYDARTGCLVVNRKHSGDVGFHPSFPSTETAPVELIEGKITLRIYVDRSSVEVFAHDGRVTITDQIFPHSASREVSLYARKGTGTIESLSVHNLGEAGTERASLDRETARSLEA